MKKLLVIPLLALSALVLTGCGDELVEGANSQIEQVERSDEAVDGLNERAQQEQDELEDQGLSVDTDD